MRKSFLILLSLTAGLVACNKNMDVIGTSSEQIMETKSGEILFTAEGEGIVTEVLSKATTAVTSLTSFNVECVTGTLGSAETEKFNATFTKDGSTSNYKGGQFWPKDDAGYKFYAANATITKAITGPTIAATNATDIVAAVLVSPTFKTTNSLVFNHIFARLGACKVTAPTNYSVSNLSVKITPKTGGTYNMFTGNGKNDGTGWSATSTGSAVTLNSGSIDVAETSTAAATDTYLVPGSYSLSVSYDLTQGAYTEHFDKTTNAQSILGGKINAINLSLPDGAASEIVFTVTVTPWGDNTVNFGF